MSLRVKNTTIKTICLRASTTFKGELFFSEGIRWYQSVAPLKCNKNTLLQRSFRINRTSQVVNQETLGDERKMWSASKCFRTSSSNPSGVSKDVETTNIELLMCTVSYMT